MTLSHFSSKKTLLAFEPAGFRKYLLLDSPINRPVIVFVGQRFPLEPIQQKANVLTQRVEWVINPGHHHHVAIPAHDVAPDGRGGDTENDLFGRQFAFW